MWRETSFVRDYRGWVRLKAHQSCRDGMDLFSLLFLSGATTCRNGISWKRSEKAALDHPAQGGAAEAAGTSQLEGQAKASQGHFNTWPSREGGPEVDMELSFVWAWQWDTAPVPSDPFTNFWKPTCLEGSSYNSTWLAFQKSSDFV